jgi:hypothetical protein
MSTTTYREVIKESLYGVPEDCARRYGAEKKSTPRLGFHHGFKNQKENDHEQDHA